MTEILLDPGEEFLRQGMADPLTPGEAQAVDYIANNPGSDLAKAAAGLGAAFMVYRLYMKRRLSQEFKGKNQVAQKDLRRAIYVSYMLFSGKWKDMILPNLVTGYAIGLAETRLGDLGNDVLFDIAENYADDLGRYMNDVSAEAVLSGYQRQLNRKVPPAKAMERVLSAYGVPPSAMNSLVSVWLSEDPKKLTDYEMPDAVKERASKIIGAELSKRAKLFGENESWNAKNQAKQIVWMYGIENGDIPKGTKRRWVTARDEKVCPTCGPMDGVAIELGTKFDTRTGKFWAPPTHVNCRCDIELEYSAPRLTLVTKARPGDPYDRDNSGRFAPSEQRSTKRKLEVLDRPSDDEVLAVLAASLQETKTETMTPDEINAQLDQIYGKLRVQQKQPARLTTLSQVQSPSLSRLSSIQSLDSEQTTASIAPLSLDQIKLADDLQTGKIQLTSAVLDKLDISIPDEPKVPHWSREGPRLMTWLMPGSDSWRESEGRTGSRSFDLFTEEGETKFVADQQSAFIDETTGLSEIEEQLGRYWNDWKNLEFDSAFREGHRDREGRYITRNIGGVDVVIHDYEYKSMIDTALVTYGLPSVRGMSDTQIPLERADKEGTANFTALEIIQSLELYERISANRMVLGVFNHTNSEESVAVSDVHRSNPGTWVASREFFAMSHVRERGEIGSNLPYRVIYFIPDEVWQKVYKQKFKTTGDE